MKAKFVVIKGAKPADIPLKLPAIIGRSREASLKVRTTIVSRKHCEVFESGGEMFVRDMGSANGTFVNNVRIEKDTQLASGDLLSVGPVTLRAILEQPQRKIPAESDSVIDLSEGVVADDEAGALSMVKYKELPQGSFIGIEDVDDNEPFAGRIDEHAVDSAEAEPLSAKVESPAFADDVNEAVEITEDDVAQEPAAPREPVQKAPGPKVPVKRPSAQKSEPSSSPKSPAASKEEKNRTAKSGKEAVKQPTVSKEAKEAIEALGGVEAEKEDQVDGGDSALNDFFKNIG